MRPTATTKCTYDRKKIDVMGKYKKKKNTTYVLRYASNTCTTIYYIIHVSEKFIEICRVKCINNILRYIGVSAGFIKERNYCSDR